MGEKIKTELPIEQKIEDAVETPGSEDLQFTAETMLREVIKREIVSKIQENFKKRNQHWNLNIYGTTFYSAISLTKLPKEEFWAA